MVNISLSAFLLCTIVFFNILLLHIGLDQLFFHTQLINLFFFFAVEIKYLFLEMNLQWYRIYLETNM